MSKKIKPEPIGHPQETNETPGLLHYNHFLQN